MTKTPNAKFNPKPVKLPHHLEIYSDDKKIFWSFALFDSGIVFPTVGVPCLDFHEIATDIKNCELRTWPDIERNKSRDHPIECYKLAKFAQERLTAIQLDDIDVLWSIHFNGKCRLWGIRIGSLMQIVWLDPNHEVCPSYKRNT